MVYSTASLNEHSDNLTGFDNGKIIGLGFICAISWITPGVNAPYIGYARLIDLRSDPRKLTLMVDKPNNAVGLT